MEYKISTIILAVVLMSGIITGSTLFYSNLASNYGYTVEDLSTLDATTDINQMAEDMQAQLTDNPFKETPLEAFYAAGTAVWQSLNILTGSFSLVQSSISGLVTNVPLIVPSWLSAMAILVVIIIMLFALASAMLKWRI